MGVRNIKVHGSVSFGGIWPNVGRWDKCDLDVFTGVALKDLFPLVSFCDYNCESMTNQMAQTQKKLSVIKFRLLHSY